MSFCPTGMLREARREGPSEESSRPYTERHHPGRNASLFREAWSPHWHPHAWYSLWSLAHLEEKSVTVRSLRGATTVPEDTPEAILAATGELLQALIDRNGITPETVISAIFSATDDLTSAYPAEKAREMGWTRAGLMCVQEMNVAGSLRGCLRVLVLWESDKPQAEVQHCYLRGAAGLRPDLE